jgi:carbonic anhydrase/acetyltransferase-like protein (isoleucine patch superfamily)
MRFASKEGLFALGSRAPELCRSAYVAPGACLIGDVELGARSSVWFCSVLRGDNGPIRVGARSNVQDAAVVHCRPGGHVSIGCLVSIGHQASIHGASVGDRCLIGMQAIVMDDAEISHDTLVAAGSVILARRRYEPGVLLRGRPARVVRALSKPEIDLIRTTALEYEERAALYQSRLLPACAPVATSGAASEIEPLEPEWRPLAALPN